MHVFLVGGAVRDILLNIPSPDRDWVVVGGTPDKMVAAGFKPVGKDFPVFLHPQTNEEYALARQERKTGKGYKGFTFHTSPDITLEEDLLRRDLTINAIAQSAEGEFLDPFNGQQDIHDKILRHVSPAFAEDPVRVLRVARFAARFHHLGFRIAAETYALMQSIVASGEIDHLVQERVWKEFSRALSEQSPSVFIEVLRDCGALKRLMPELDMLFGIPQPEKHHPEIDTGLHSLLSLDRCAQLTPSAEARFAALIHDLGKGLTPPEKWPSHHGHEHAARPSVVALCDRLGAPNSFRDLALGVAEFHTHGHRALELTAKTLLTTLQRLDAYRRPERFKLFCICCQADAQGRTGLEHQPYPQADYLQQALETLQSIDTKAMAVSGLKGAAFGDALHKKRLSRLEELKRSTAHN